MKALLVADLHYDLRKLDWVLAEAEDVDLLVIAGDLLDIGSRVPLDAQITVSLEYLVRCAARATTVTAAPSGRGWLVLFHVTADPSWSNLPLSGTFVERLRRIVAFSSAARTASADKPGQPAATIAPWRLLDGYGRFVNPGVGAGLPGLTALMASGVYAIPRIETDTVSVVTNTTPLGAYRGAGRPEAESGKDVVSAFCFNNPISRSNSLLWNAMSAAARVCFSLPDTFRSISSGMYGNLYCSFRLTRFASIRCVSIKWMPVSRTL